MVCTLKGICTQHQIETIIPTLKEVDLYLLIMKLLTSKVLIKLFNLWNLAILKELVIWLKEEPQFT